jgi:hypothetical protein
MPLGDHVPEPCFELGRANILISDLPEQNAVKCGSLYHKPKEIEALIARSTRLLALEAEGIPDFIGRSGSCTLIRHADAKFVVCTRHQLDIAAGQSPSADQLKSIRFTSFNNPNVLTNIPVTNCIFETGNSSQEFHDLLVFRVQDEWGELPQEAPYFFPMKRFHGGAKRNSSWFFGCPSSQIEMEYEPQKKTERSFRAAYSIPGSFQVMNSTGDLYTKKQDETWTALAAARHSQ